MLDIRDLKVGVELECIESFSDIFKTGTRWFNVGEVFVVSSVYANAFLIEEEFGLHENKLKYFKKKEDKTPHNFGNAMCDKDDVKYTFDDLIDVSTKAFKDRVVFSLGITICGVSIVLSNKKEEFFSINDISDGIEFIQSLYKETFVIEVQEDIERLKNGAKVTLKNCEVIYFSNIDNGDCWFDFDHVDCQKFPFLALKGATVEQKLN